MALLSFELLYEYEYDGVFVEFNQLLLNKKCCHIEEKKGELNDFLF